MALQLIEIRIVRLRTDQIVDMRKGVTQIAETIRRNRARVARRKADVGLRVAAQNFVGPVHETVQLRPHHVVPELQLRRVFLIPVLGVREIGQRGHALLRHRMVLRVRIDEFRFEHRLVGEALERVIHALGRLPGHGQEAHAGAVGVVLLGALIRQQRIQHVGLRRAEYRQAGIADVGAAGARAGGDGAGAEQHGDNGRGLRVGEFLAHLRQMAADDVSGLVGKDADDLVGGLGLHQCAGIDEDAVRIHHERVEGAVVDDHHMNVLIA